MRAPGDNDPTSYTRLRRWYLARLRKTALANTAGADITPATLVKLDQETMQKVLATTGTKAEQAQFAPPAVSKDKPFSWLRFSLSYWASTLVLTILLVLQMKSFNLSESANCLIAVLTGHIERFALPLPFYAAPIFFVGWPLYLIAMHTLAGIGRSPTPSVTIEQDRLE